MQYCRRWRRGMGGGLKQTINLINTYMKTMQQIAQDLKHEGLNFEKYKTTGDYVKLYLETIKSNNITKAGDLNKFAKALKAI